MLRVQELQNGAFVLATQRRAHAHVTEDGAGDLRRKTLWRLMTTRAVLPESSFAIARGLWTRILILLVRRRGRGHSSRGSGDVPCLKSEKENRAEKNA